MQAFEYKNKNPKRILALGAESNGNFSVFKQNRLYFSEDFGDLQEKANFARYKKYLTDFMNKNKLQPEIILSDLHPDYVTTELAENLAKKYGAKHIQIQHHLAHIFSAIGDKKLQTNPPVSGYKLQTNMIGIACDGTGYGLNGKIWGGEIFEIKNKKIRRIGHLENQILLGGELAIQEPARMLISIFSKFLAKKEIYKQVNKYYSASQFEVLYNQLRQNFNCIETSSTGRVLDAVSLLLGFCENKRNHKHEPIELLEKNSTKPYAIKPIIKNNILLATPLFEYLAKNISKDKKRLAATAQIYIAKGLYEIVKNKKNAYFAGGVANNKIISTYLESRGVYTNKKIPRGDAGLSFGQIIFYLTNKSAELTCL